MSYLFDCVGGLLSYLGTHKTILLGNDQNHDRFEIYRDRFPESGTKTALSVYLELSQNSELDGIMYGDIRIIVRSPRKENAFTITLNADKLMNNITLRPLSTTIELCTCVRNSGPSWFEEEDSFHYYTMLYSMTFRQT